jgi:hypothetical protein
MKATAIAFQHVGLFIKLQLMEEANFHFHDLYVITNHNKH